MNAVIAPESTTEPAVRISNLGMVYPGGIRALEGVNLEVGEGEFLAILGLSGSGKSTLLRCINRLIDPTEGKVWIFGQEITALSGSGLRRLRRQVRINFGFCGDVSHVADRPLGHRVLQRLQGLRRHFCIHSSHACVIVKGRSGLFQAVTRLGGEGVAELDQVVVVAAGRQSFLDG